MNKNYDDMKTKLLTSESVTEGHPDKVCDKISDAILDALLQGDPDSHVAVETLISKDLLVLSGEVKSTHTINYRNIVDNVLKDIGYNKTFGFDTQNYSLIININEQSADIDQGVTNDDQGAGDQGIMFGYATNETENFMPITIDLAHKLTQRLAYVRKNNLIEGLGPDGKSQVSVEFDENNKPKRIHTIVIAQQHLEKVSEDLLKREIFDQVIVPVCSHLLDEETIIHINSTGKFVIGGPCADTGLTGRKIIVDTYGGIGRHGGGAFSGKDPSKVDRSAAYMARFLAKKVVSLGLANKCEIQLGYSIGVSRPVSININTYNTGDEDEILNYIENHFDLRPANIIKFLDLKKPVYYETSAYGHFGRNGFTWEKVN